jgi:hypothetical protein
MRISPRKYFTGKLLHSLGKEIENLDGLLSHILEAEYKFPGVCVLRLMRVRYRDLGCARQIRREGVCALLGGSKKAFPVYGSSMRRDITPQDES